MLLTSCLSKIYLSFDHVAKRKWVLDSDTIHFPIIPIQCQNKIEEYNTKDPSTYIFIVLQNSIFGPSDPVRQEDKPIICNQVDVILYLFDLSISKLYPPPQTERRLHISFRDLWQCRHKWHNNQLDAVQYWLKEPANPKRSILTNL